MALTREEAEERAARIWGPDLIVIKAFEGSKADWFVEERGRVRIVHSLDGNGHALCHGGCEAAEQAAYPTPTDEPMQTPDASLEDELPIRSRRITVGFLQVTWELHVGHGTHRIMVDNLAAGETAASTWTGYAFLASVRYEDVHYIGATRYWEGVLPTEAPLAVVGAAPFLELRGARVETPR